MDRLLAVIRDGQAAIDEKKALLIKQSAEFEELKKQVAVGDKSLENRQTELTKLQSELEAGIKAQDKDKEKRLSDLVKTISVMKPAQVVPIFEKMDLETIVTVVTRLKPKVAAKILEKMNAKHASKIMEMVRGR